MKSLCTILSFLFSLGALWGQHTVTGTVTSATGEPLIGVNILIKGTGNGTATDIDGTYSIAVPDEKAVLVFTYTGFKGKELVPGALTTLDVVLDEDVELIDEVVVIGYGTQKKSDLTGAISTIKSDEVKRVPSANVEQILQGKVAGVQVTPVSGRPGEGAVVRIRGVGTLNDASPLYVVDGMLLDDISFLNPNDIASIEVLKDASATAIYGSRGANGVVIVSTNQGANHQARFNFSSYYASQQVVRQIDMVNGTEFATLANEVATNEGRKPLFADPEKYGVGTNWQDVIFQTAPIQNYQISANGGNDNVLYNISVNHFDQEGIVRGSRYQRTTVRINNEYSLRKNIKVGHNISLIASKNDYEANVIGMAYQAEPIIPVFDSLGNFADATVRIPVGNPEVSIFYNYNKGNGLRTVGNTYLEAKLLKYFTFKSNFGLDIQQGRSKRYTPVFEVTPTSLQRNEQSSLSVNSDRSNSWLWENTMSFYREWTNHRLNVLGGVTAQEYVFESLGGSRINFPGDTPEFYYLNAGETDGQTNYNTSYEWAMLSYLGRINYTFKDRYLLTASFRADGSSRFGKNNRYGYFPSFAVGWNITNEPFMSSIPLFSRLKLRASWGQIGNDKIGAYAGRPTVTSNLIAVFGRNEAIQNGASIVSLANPDIRWEETTQSNAGFEFGLLDNRLQGNLDYYVRTTNDILVNVPIPEYIGADASPVINAAKVRNQGLDFNVSWRESKGKFDYEIGILGSTVNNEVLALGEGQEEIFGGGLGVGGLLGTRTVVGLPIGAFYGYKVDGLYQNQSDLESYPVQGSEVPGDLRFVDTNNDGVITTADRTYIGSPIPSLIYGFNLSAGYAGFDLAVDFNGQYGNKIINAKKMARFGTYNFEASYLNRWTGEGTSDSEPRVTNGGHNYEFSERFVEDGSFMRLRTIQFGYTLPDQVTSRIKFSSIRFYASGTNLVTWTKYSGYTPEITNASSIIAVGIDQGVYPIAKVITFGLDANFNLKMKQAMKSIHQSIILAGLLLMIPLQGCQDLLEKKPLGQLTSDNFFQNETHALWATNAVYNLLRNWEVHVFSYIGMTDIVSDDADKGSTPNDANFLLEIDDFTYDAGNLAMSTVWSGYFRGIYRANLAIDNIPNIDMNENLKARYIAENKFLRAYFYFTLVRWFGDLPLILKPLTPDEYKQPRVPAADVYAAIIQDLQDAADVLPDSYPATETGRATRGAANAYLAKVYLTIGDFGKAEEFAMKVINSGVYGLFPDYAKLFLPEGENSIESVFEVQSTALDIGGAGSQYNEVQGVRGVPNLGWGFNRPSDDLIAEFERGDPRRDATILYVGEVLPDGSAYVQDNPEIVGERYNQKAWVPEHTGGNGNGPGNIRLFRYAEVLLIAAEALNENGNTAQALTYLNMVRARARGGKAVLPDVTLTDKSALRNAIWHERRVELGMEQHRWFDLLRQGRADQVMAKLKPKFTAGKNELFPIPQSEIDLSGGQMTQNPGY